MMLTKKIGIVTNIAERPIQLATMPPRAGPTMRPPSYPAPISAAVELALSSLESSVASAIDPTRNTPRLAPFGIQRRNCRG